MGLLDILRGKRELKQPADDRLFAMSTAYVKLDMELGLHTSGKAAIVFQPLATADFEAIVRDMVEVVKSTGEETGTRVDSTDDEFGYRWIVLSDDEMEDLVVGVNAVSDRDPGRRLRRARAVRRLRPARRRRQARLLDLQLQARLVLSRSCPPTGRSSATPSASCA